MPEDLTQNNQNYKLRSNRIIFVFLVIITISLSFIAFNSLRFSNRTSVGASDTHLANTAKQTETDPVIDNTPQFLAEEWHTNLAHDENRYTAALLVGIDARYSTIQNGEYVNLKPYGAAGLRNADAIMQVVYDHTTGYVFMISIPRDMGIDINKDCLKFSGSIFWVYDKGQKSGCPGGGIQVMKDAVESITGIKSQYHAFFNMDFFKEAYDLIAETNSNGEKGIWVDNPTAFSEKYPYNDYGWESVYFPAGRQFMTAERALRFIRSRQYSYDWGRAARQQILLTAIKDRVLAADNLFNPVKILGLINLIREKLLFTMPSFTEIVEIYDLSQKLDNSKIIHLVLGPDFGGKEAYIDRQPHGRRGPYYMTAKGWKECPPGNEFCKVQEFILNIIDEPKIFSENATIYAYSTVNAGDGSASFSNSLFQAMSKKKYPWHLSESKIVVNKPEGSKVSIIDYSEGSKPYTLSLLSKELGVKPLQGSQYTSYRQNKEDIAIIVSPD